ncbi:hypothetical protein [Bacillus massiliigorillae]|uniref:hypothetical protein n=1 Tax=Bacillus massiliigorillae TaxID=1243664 RepID=UPI00039ECC08|nr:hypothetical protein [Bacillus massiliigorillae]
MDFCKAYKEMRDGKKIKRKEWGGYWVIENGTIMIYCKDGTVLDILDTKDLFFTIENMLEDDWVVIDEDISINEITINFQLNNVDDILAKMNEMLKEDIKKHIELA